MPACAECGGEHPLLDPAFARPDAYVAMTAADRATYGRATDDTCRLTLPGAPERFFIRGTLPVEVDGVADGLHWGLWIEVSGPTYARVVQRWSDDDQHLEPPFTGILANGVPTYPSTIGLPLGMRLTGPQTRPEFCVVDPPSHPFAVECARGVSAHRAAEWIDAVMRG